MDSSEFAKEIKKKFVAISLLSIGMLAIVLIQSGVIVKKNKFIDRQAETIDDNYSKIRELQYQVFERDSLIMELESDLMK